MSEGTLSGRRILVVEDDYFLADDCDRELRAAGATVLGPVPSVEAARELLDNDAPDVVVLDANLGGQMAYPVADALVARNVPFLFMTGYDQSKLPVRFAAIRRVEKPAAAREILGELKRLLNTA